METEFSMDLPIGMSYNSVVQKIVTSFNFDGNNKYNIYDYLAFTQKLAADHGLAVTSLPKSCPFYEDSVAESITLLIRCDDGLIKNHPMHGKKYEATAIVNGISHNGRGIIAILTFEVTTRGLLQ